MLSLPAGFASLTMRGNSPHEWNGPIDYSACPEIDYSRFWAIVSAEPVLCNGPEAEVSEELCECGGLVVGVEAAWVGEDPGVAAAEGGFLEANAGVFDAGDDAIGADADEGDDGGAPAFDLGLEAPAAGAKFVVGEFIGAGGGALDDVGDAEIEVEKEGF